MAEAKKTATKKTTTTRRRARTETGAFKADDPNTPDVNEAWEEVPAEEPKAEPVKAPADGIVWYESREPEPTQFSVAGYNPIRNFSNGRLEFRVKAEDVERFEKNHFCMNARIVRKR